MSCFRPIAVILLICWNMALAIAQTGISDSLRKQIQALEGENQTKTLPSQQLLELGRLYFYASVEDESYLSKAEILFQRLLSDSELSYTAKMYQATLLTLKAKHAFWPQDKFKYCNQGLELMDKIVQIAPNQLEIRFLRASTCFYLPFFFNRKQQAIADFKVILTLLPKAIGQYPNSLLNNICSFLRETKLLQPAELAQLQTIEIQLQKLSKPVKN
ncbi:MAG: hypothetical protein NZ108_09040 [Bacteroidia bacterium]|nr:hypothetical protein [Bacteroidia bacterium]